MAKAVLNHFTPCTCNRYGQFCGVSFIIQTFDKIYKAMKTAVFTVNPFQENSSVVYDESGECAIIDPGFSNRAEQKELVDFIDKHQLKPVLLLNTHCHIDHILGNRFVADTYKLKLQIHPLDRPLLDAAKTYAHMYGLDYDHSPDPEILFEEGDIISFGKTKMDILHLPGHAPGHVIFVHHASKTIIGGDIIFRGSIGRTDLPGGNHQDLLDSIEQKLFTLPDDYTVYPGHGPTTTVGFEKRTNPFFQG